MCEIISIAEEISVIVTGAPAISEFCAKPFKPHCKNSMKWGPESPLTGEEPRNREAKQHAPGPTASETQSSVSDPGGRAQSHLFLFTKAKKENESRGRKKMKLSS